MVESILKTEIPYLKAFKELLHEALENYSNNKFPHVKESIFSLKVIVLIC